MRTKKVKKHIGRPSIFDEGLTLKDLIKVYEKGLSCRKAAAALGIDPRTYRNYVKREGLDTKFTRPSPGPSIEFANGFRVPKLLLWCRENPRRKLPRGFQKISDVTGIPFGTIRSYLVRRRRRMVKWANKLGDLRALESKILIDNTGRHIPLELIETYDLRVDTYDLRVRLSMMLRGGIHLKAELPWQKYAELFGLTPQEAPWALKKRVAKPKEANNA